MWGLGMRLGSPFQNISQLKTNRTSVLPVKRSSLGRTRDFRNILRARDALPYLY